MGKCEFVVLCIYLSTNELGYMINFLSKIQSKHPQSKHLQRAKLKFLPFPAPISYHPSLNGSGYKELFSSISI